MAQQQYFFLFIAIISAVLLEQKQCNAKATGSGYQEILTTDPAETVPLGCELVPLEIDFMRDLKWNWIVAPATLDIGDCHGSCPTANFYNLHEYSGSTHSQIKAYAGKPLESCCVPTEYQGVHVLANINGSININYIEDMKVTKCGCVLS